jgi:hypothetical protein
MGRFLSFMFFEDEARVLLLLSLCFQLSPSGQPEADFEDTLWFFKCFALCCSPQFWRQSLSFQLLHGVIEISFFLWSLLAFPLCTCKINFLLITSGSEFQSNSASLQNASCPLLSSAARNSSQRINSASTKCVSTLSGMSLVLKMHRWKLHLWLLRVLIIKAQDKGSPADGSYKLGVLK